VQDHSISRAAASAKGSGTDLPTCQASQLHISKDDVEPGAGSLTFDLSFTNSSSSSCAMLGFPGVSFMDVKFDVLGEPAVRTKESATVVTLRPGHKASAEVRTANGQSGYSAQQCDLVSVPSLKVYPPNQKQYLVVAWNQKSCVASGLHNLQIGPVHSE
jgi:hypothetical protein